MSPVRESVQRGHTIFQLFETGTEKAVIQVTAKKSGNRAFAHHVIQVLQLLYANGVDRDRLVQMKTLMSLQGLPSSIADYMRLYVEVVMRLYVDTRQQHSAPLPVQLLLC